MHLPAGISWHRSAHTSLSPACSCSWSESPSPSGERCRPLQTRGGSARRRSNGGCRRHLPSIPMRPCRASNDPAIPTWLETDLYRLLTSRGIGATSQMNGTSQCICVLLHLAGEYDGNG